MLNFPVNSSDFRLFLPTAIWLEPEHFAQAIELSNQVNDPAQKWRTYLHSLAVIALEKWLCDRLSEKQVIRDNSLINYLRVGDFKFYLIATEHLLDEVVAVPQAAIAQSESAVHFYVLLEVLEEQEEVIFRGFLRYDTLVNYRQQATLQIQDGCYQIPLSLFDTEPNHLLYYCRFLEPTAIPIPVVSPEENSLGYFPETRTKLSQWLQGIVDESWLAIDALLNPQANLAFSTRNIDRSLKRGKLINLGVQLGNQTIALLLNIAQESEDKLSVFVQLHPTGGERFLPPNIELSLLSKAGKKLQQVTSRNEDNYIQLKSFKGDVGNRFSVEVSLGDVSIREDFEL
ncbi:MAG: DUF1822 family protein [Nostocaceae cyanobacterium]|nr:DUF1822 family protein [Nostocaceae cyanobacterium]